MKRTILAAAAALALLSAFLSAPAMADGVALGGSAFATSIAQGGHLTNVATALLEMQYDAQLSDNLLGELVSFVGISDTGGGRQMGVGYRQFFKVGSKAEAWKNARPKWLGLGIGGFGAGDGTPELNQTTIFVGPELLVRFPVGATSEVTGLFGAYPGMLGETHITMIRAGVNVAAPI